MANMPNQIVVATENLALVEAQLTAAGLSIVEKNSNARLGLTLVELSQDGDLHRAAETLWADVPEDERTVLRHPDEDGLDALLASLRDRFARRYSGWTPPMGKNRLAHGVELLPYASVVGALLPEPVTGLARTAATRPQLAGTERPVRVGIIDVRLAPHPRLEGAYLADPDGLDLPGAGQERQGWRGHATFVANIILECAPSAELVCRTALEEIPDAGNPDDRFHMPLWRLAERLLDFEDAGVQVLNCSLGCETLDGQPPLVLDRAIARLSSTMVVVAAAGNHGSPDLNARQRQDPLVPTDPSAALFPAALDNVLAVGTRDQEGRIVPFNPRDASGKGWAPWIDGFAPGTDIVSAYLGAAYLGDGKGSEPIELPVPGTAEVQQVDFSGWAKWSGSSFAAAHTTGTIAALIAEGKSPEQALAAVRCREDFSTRGPVTPRDTCSGGLAASS